MDIVVINGFLGSGKTSVISSILNTDLSNKYALLINEFGSYDIDGKLLDNLNDHIISIKNGSIFCSCKSDSFVTNMLALCQLDIDTILIESSGFSNPVALFRLLDFIIEKAVSVDIKVKSVVTVVCPYQYEKLINSSTSYFNQIAISDVIVINKTDISSEEKVAEVVDAINNINSDAVLFKTQFGQISYSELPENYCANKEIDSLIEQKDLSQQRMTIELQGRIKREEIKQLLEKASSYCLRIKGFVSCVEGDFLIQMASNQLQLTPCSNKDNKIVVLYSSYMSSKEKIIGIFTGFKKFKAVVL